MEVTAMFRKTPTILTSAVFLVTAFGGFEQTSLEHRTRLDETRSPFFEPELPEYLCTPPDECRRNRRNKVDTLLYRNCECDKGCASRETCCSDSPYVSKMKRNKYKKKCKKVAYSDLYVFVKTRCGKGWTGDPVIRRLCEGDPNILKDLHLFLPVTNPVTKVTYKNYFCAFCHNDHENVAFWDISISFDGSSLQEVLSNSEYVKNRRIDELIFNDEQKAWGVTYVDRDDNMEKFNVVGIKVSVPDELVPSVRFCYSHLVESCVSTWRNATIAKKCAEYMDAVAVNLIGDRRGRKERFRNMHCALCNHAKNLDDYSCVKSLISLSGFVDLGNTSPSDFGLPFYLLLDVNKGTGNRVGKVETTTKPKCRSDQVFDRDFKKCKRLRCALPGYVIRNGRCVQEQMRIKL